MTSIFSDGAVHPGRDPNDAWWIVVRRPDDWGVDPRPDATRYDPSRMVLELAPRPLVGGGGAATVTTVDGTRYTVDPIGCHVVVQLPCDLPAAPLREVGGPGREVGRLGRPVAIASDERGWLYVVEADNHRVTVLEVVDGRGRVVVTLGAVDGWGRPIAGDGPGALRDPVAVAVGGGRIFVGQQAGWVQAYDRAFRTGPRFAARRPGAALAPLVAVAADAGGRLVAVDAAGAVLRFACDGAFVDEVGWADVPASLAGLAGLARYELEGTRVVGPIDGGRDGLAWHQIAVDAELPPGTSIEVQTWCADAIAAAPPALGTVPTLPELRLPPEATPWAPEAPVPVPTVDEPRRGESTRLVHADVATWTRWRGGPYRRGAAWALAGTGPNASAGFTTSLADARRLRVGDELELTARGLPPVVAAVTAIAPSELAVIASGDVGVLYGAGATVRLRERAGRAQDEPVLTTLAAGEAIDLTGITVDGGGGDVVVAHRVAALLRRGDLIVVAGGGATALVKIDEVAAAPRAVTLAAPVAGDYRDATLRLVATVDRLVCEDGAAWGAGFPPASRLDVVARVAGVDVHQALEVAWSEPDTATVWTTAPASPDWITLGIADEPAATDRGRYLWIKLRLRGARRDPADSAAFATPTIRALRAVAPRLSYLSYLPAVFGRRDADTPTGATYLERFLAMFEGRLTRVEERFELVARLLNPFAADDEWLAFVASWFELVLDPRWPRRRRAALLAQIVELYRLRGTRAGLVRTVAAFTGHEPALIEGFQIRPRAGMVLGCAGVLGCAPLGGLDVDGAATEQLLAAYAHRLELVVFVDDDCDLAAATSGVAALVDAIKPAHVDVTLRVTTRASRIGLESTIGLDFVLTDRTAPAAPVGGSSAQGFPAPILGVDARLAPRAAGPGAAASADAPTIGDFSLR
ncbi:MAG: phage tail protein [Kofleriaceae bacterium]